MLELGLGRLVFGFGQVEVSFSVEVRVRIWMEVWVSDRL